MSANASTAAPPPSALSGISPKTKLFVIWLVVGSLAAGVCSLVWPAAHLGSEYLPVGSDSFYHARRILDTARDPESFYEFDSKIHAPEGSLLVWPWGYDYAMGWVVRIGMKLGLADDPMAILIWIPVAAVFISIGLILLITQRLGLSRWAGALTCLCVALSPLTQYLHGVGFIDHHYAEYIFVLAAIAAGLGWLQKPENPYAAAILGVALGIAPAVQNAMFILQVPILSTLLIFWWQGLRMPFRSTAFFGTALVASTIAILLPSVPFQNGMFEYYLLSWFHLYIACCTACVALLAARLRKEKRTIALLLLAGTILVVPLSYQISMARSFLSGDIVRLDTIAEMYSVSGWTTLHGVLNTSSQYSLFIWFVPVSFVYCLYKAYIHRRMPFLLFWISSIYGLTLLLVQVRLQYFGSFALYIPLIAMIDGIANSSTHQREFRFAALLAVLLLYAPSLRYQLPGPMPPAGDEYFPYIRPLLGTLKNACSSDPGVVLADNDAGHYIRYYTDCSVIANNFLLTKQHASKVEEIDELFSTAANNLAERAPQIKYILMRPAGVFVTSEKEIRYASFGSKKNSELMDDLLLKPIGPAAIPLPNEYELLDEIRWSQNQLVPYARLYKIKH